MTFPWLVAGAALIAALLAWRRARATARRLEQLTQMYWELRYQHGELRVKVQRLSGDEPRAERVADADADARPPSGFVPLSSLKR
jgi:hypothetical protein